MRIVAGITVFRPDSALLFDLVDRLSQDRVSILVQVDGETGDAVAPKVLERLAAIPSVDVGQVSHNAGIGAALNALVTRARAQNADRLVLFDQDSTPPPELAARLSARMDALVAAGERPMAIGPRAIVPAAAPGDYRAPRYLAMPGSRTRPDARPVRFLITSGMMLDLSAFDRVGPFREDYWIDAVDTEWCFRAWSRGGSVWLAPDLAMEHRVGQSVVRRGPISFPRQSPARMETYLRNQAHGLRLPHVPLGWKLRSVVYLPLQALLYSLDRTRPARTLAGLARAARNGWAGRLGRPRGRPDA